jgi:hypothetical protein
VTARKFGAGTSPGQTRDQGESLLGRLCPRHLGLVGSIVSVGARAISAQRNRDSRARQQRTRSAGCRGDADKGPDFFPEPVGAGPCLQSLGVSPLLASIRIS